MLLEHCKLTGEAGRFKGRIHQDWEIWGPNGGYLSAIAMNAVAQMTPFSQPVSFYAMYLGVGAFDEVDLSVTPVRVGRNTGVYTVEMVQNDRKLLQAQVITANEQDGFEHQDSLPPFKILPDELTETKRESTFRFWDNFECRFEDDLMASGEPSGKSEWGCWYRFLDCQPENHFQDAMRSLVLIDTLPWPANFMRYGREGLKYMAPSLDLYVQFHRFATEQDWLFGHATCEEGAMGFLGGKGATWDESGRLLASGGSQLMCRPMPDQS